MPSFASSVHSHSVYDPNLLAAQADGDLSKLSNFGQASAGNAQASIGTILAKKTLEQQGFVMTVNVPRRLVRVLVVDPSADVPLENSVLYKGDEQLTDLNDQELFFSIDIQGLLKVHNEARVKVVDKHVKDRTEFLEPAKIRDLKMIVVTIAQF